MTDDHDRLRPMHAARTTSRSGTARAAGCRWAPCCADAGAGTDALGPYEVPEPADPDVARLIREFVRRAGYESSPSGQGWQIVVPLRLDRRQAVYVGPAGTDAEGRAILALVSVCGPANDRDCRTLLKLNARIVEGHFAIRVLRGEEYFVVIENLPADSPDIDRRARAWSAASPSSPTAWRNGSRAAATSTDDAPRCRPLGDRVSSVPRFSGPGCRPSGRSRSSCRRV